MLHPVSTSADVKHTAAVLAELLPVDLGNVTLTQWLISALMSGRDRTVLASSSSSRILAQRDVALVACSLLFVACSL